MGPGKTTDTLRNAFGQFAQPFTTSDQVKVVPMRFDAIVAMLLGSPDVRASLGAIRASELEKASPELPALLRDLGEGAFAAAAEHASDLLEISRSSVGDFDDTEDEIMMANAAREKFYQACTGILASLDR